MYWSAYASKEKVKINCKVRFVWYKLIKLNVNIDWSHFFENRLQDSIVLQPIFTEPLA